MHGWHGAGTQAGSTVPHIDLQCELLLPSVTTSTKANAELNISDISDVDHDDDNVADNTQSSVYQEIISASEPESDVPVEKQQTY